MSQTLVNTVWRSALPNFLKRGVAGALAAFADDDGTFRSAPTVTRLIAHRYYNGARLSKRTVQNQLHALARVGVLLIEGAGGGRGHARAYALHVEALDGVCASDPLLRPAHRRPEADRPQRVQQTTPRKGATGVEKGATEGCNRAPGKGATKGATAAGYVQIQDPVPVQTRPGQTRPPDVWRAAQLKMAVELGSMAFGKWLRDSHLLHDNGTEIQVAVALPCDARWIQKHYAEPVRRALHAIRPDTQVTFVVAPEPVEQSRYVARSSR